MKKYIIAGIGTDVGKTLIASILTEYLQADFWKPIQSGNLDATDSMTVQSLISNTKTKIHPEAYRLSIPQSPHAAAKKDKIKIELGKIKIPLTSNNFMIIEGAGGLLVPLNNEHLVIDLIPHLQAEVILVCRVYLGCINHSLLSIEALKSRSINIKGIIFNGKPNPESESAILEFSCIPKLFRVPEFEAMNKEVIHKFASELPPSLL